MVNIDLQLEEGIYDLGKESEAAKEFELCTDPTTIIDIEGNANDTDVDIQIKLSNGDIILYIYHYKYNDDATENYYLNGTKVSNPDWDQFIDGETVIYGIMEYYKTLKTK